MPKIVNIKGYGQVSFPDSATNDEIQQVLSSFQKPSKASAQAVIAPQTTGQIAPLPRPVHRQDVQTDPINRGLTSLYANLPSPTEALTGMLQMSPMGMGYQALQNIRTLQANPNMGMTDRLATATHGTLPIDAKALGSELGSGMYADAAGRLGATALQALLMRRAFGESSPNKPFQSQQPNVFAPPIIEKGLGEMAMQDAIKQGGGVYRGIQRVPQEYGLPDLVLFDEPTSKSTLALPMNTPITSQAVAAKIAATRKNFMPTQPAFNYR